MKGSGGCNGQLALSKGPGRTGIRYHGQIADIPSKGFIFHTINMCQKYLNNINMCLFTKKGFQCAG
jgi:hypothetical protein